MCTKEEVQNIADAAEGRMREYTNTSHHALAQTISNLMGDHGEKLTAILEQVKKTNGRVTELETWRAVHTSESAGTSKALEEVKTTLYRLNWLLITAVVVALLNLVIKS